MAQGSGGGVARVGEGVAALGIGLVVQAHKAALGHVDLAADLDGALAVGAHVGKRRLGQVHGHVLDGAHVERHVLARGAVAARGCAHEGAILVGKRHAQAVDLELAGIGDAAGTKCVLGTLEPCVELVQIHGVVHGIHARHVRDRRKLLAHVAAHALGIAVGRHKVGVGRLDLLQLNEHFVEGGIRDFGRVEHVVSVGMVVELVAQLSRARCRLGAGVGQRDGIRARGRFGIDVHAVTKQARLLHSGTPSLDFKRIQEYHRSRQGRIAVSNRTESAAVRPGWTVSSDTYKSANRIELKWRHFAPFGRPGAAHRLISPFEHPSEPHFHHKTAQNASRTAPDLYVSELTVQTIPNQAPRQLKVIRFPPSPGDHYGKRGCPAHGGAAPLASICVKRLARIPGRNPDPGPGPAGPAVPPGTGAAARR